MEQLVPDDFDACRNCKRPLAGRFCAHCGQRRVDSRDRTIQALLQRLVGEITNLDGKLWSSVRVLLFKPGELSLAYVEGRRVSYLHPWRLFLVLNVIYFLVQPFTGFGGYNTAMSSQANRQVYSQRLDLRGVLSARVGLELRETLEAEGVDPDSLDRPTYESRGRTVSRLYEERFNSRSSTYAGSLILLFIPAFTALLWLLYGRRKDALLADHAVFATHFMAWELFAIGCIYLPLVGLLSRVSILLAGGREPFFQLLQENPALGVIQNFISEQSSLLIVGVYGYLALRRAYQDSRGGALLRASVLVVASVPFVVAYRLILFWLTFWTV